MWHKHVNHAASRSLRRLVLGAAALSTALSMSALPASALQLPNPLTEQVTGCQEMYTILPVDPQIADAKVPDRYAVRIFPDGAARLVFAVYSCLWTNTNDPVVHAPAEIDVVHLAVFLEGQVAPPDTTDWPWQTGSKFYDLAVFTRGDKDLPQVKDLLQVANKAGWPVTEPKFLSFSFSSGQGQLIERGWDSDAVGVQWQETNFIDIPDFALGMREHYFYDLPNEERRFDVITHRKIYRAVGILSIDATPGSVLADFGTHFTAQSYYLTDNQDWISSLEST